MERQATIDPALVHRSVDQRVVLRDVSWSEYETLLTVRGDEAGVRMAYLEGTLELMTPSRDHLTLKKAFARLLEAYAEERQETMRGVEPDECYSIGPAGDVPDLAVEIVWTSGGLEKLDIYRRLGVREVWRWVDGTITIFALRGDRHERVDHSEVLRK